MSGSYIGVLYIMRNDANCDKALSLLSPTCSLFKQYLDGPNAVPPPAFVQYVPHLHMYTTGQHFVGSQCVDYIRANLATINRNPNPNPVSTSFPPAVQHPRGNSAPAHMQTPDGMLPPILQPQQTRRNRPSEIMFPQQQQQQRNQYPGQVEQFIDSQADPNSTETSPLDVSSLVGVGFATAHQGCSISSAFDAIVTDEQIQQAQMMGGGSDNVNELAQKRMNTIKQHNSQNLQV